MNGTAGGFYHSDKVFTTSLHMNHGSWGPSRPQSGYINGIGGRDAIAQNGKSIGRVCCNGHNSYPLPLTPIFFFLKTCSSL